MMSNTSPSYAIGTFVFSKLHKELVSVLSVENVWGHSVHEVWIPSRQVVEKVDSVFLNFPSAPSIDKDSIKFTVAAARIVDALSQDVLLSALEAGVIPLPHQLHALSRAVSGDEVRYLLADEVGLGKTIEAGLVFRELKLRGLAKRVLVVAPKGLVSQWVQEMRIHFGEEFKLLTPNEFSSLRGIDTNDNVWKRFDQVVCPLDSVKPIERRSGWSPEKVEAYNQERLGDLLEAGWDLIICDEAHRLGGSSEHVARYRLGKSLAEAAPYLLLLSATPHQGKTESFQRLMALLDKDEFVAGAEMRRQKVAPFVIRTEKRQAINDRGEALFLPRFTKLIGIEWLPKHALQKQLYESVTEYVRLSYNQAIQQKRHYLGFLMILMQRLVTSSTEAISIALARRLEALENASNESVDERSGDFGLQDSDVQERLEELLALRIAGLKNEKEEVKGLLELTRKCQSQGPDARAETLLEILYEKQRDENNPDLKYLIFTEFVPTQKMLRDFLTEHGFSVVCLNGSMDLSERRRVQNQFAHDARILISTDAGGEGLNLQFAHIIVNYDLPWNPMRIEQRIGRVDRIGQKFPVHAYNLIFQNSVEMRVQEVLEQKLATILDEFGIDKTEDVLDSAESGVVFENLYAQAFLDPSTLEKNVETFVQEIRRNAKQELAGRSFYDKSVLNPNLAQELSNHPLPYWVEQMTTAFIHSAGGSVDKNIFGYNLRWPDGFYMDRVSFHSKEAHELGLNHVNLEDLRVRPLITKLNRLNGTELIPTVKLRDIPSEMSGYWSLWRISVGSERQKDQKMIALFQHDDGRVLLPTANRIWDIFLQENLEFSLSEPVSEHASFACYKQLRAAAEKAGENCFHELQAKCRQRLRKEYEKGKYAFQVRREGLNRIGLPEVKQHRLKKLDDEEQSWKVDMENRERIVPDLQAVMILRIEALP